MAQNLISNLLPDGTVVLNRWEVEIKIGRGGFGEVFRCKDLKDDKIVALKVIPKALKKIKNPNVPNIYEEARALKAVQGKKFFTRYHSCGDTLLFDFLVMELIGSNLRFLRKTLPEKKFSVFTTLSMSRMMLKAIEYLHEAGYLHRDIKPSNFAMGIGEKAGRVYLIDFGLCKRYVSDSGEQLPLKSKVPFKGTIRYASTNVLNHKDAGRRDDLISLFYTLFDLAVRRLPWNKITTCQQMSAMKSSCDYSKLLGDFPLEFLRFFEQIKGLRTRQKPNYDLLLSILNFCLEQCALSMPTSENEGNMPGIPYWSEDYISQAISTETTITGDMLDDEESQGAASSCGY